MEITNQQVQAIRSSFVTVLAWIFIVIAGFATLISIMQNIMINTMFPIDQMQGAMSAAKTKQNIPAFVDFMANHIRLFFAAFLVVSAGTFVSAIALLKRKDWARIAFICLMALGIAWNVGGLFVQFAVFSSIQQVPPNASPEFPQFESMASIMFVFSSIVAVGLSVIFGWIIKRLISPTISREFRPTL